MPFAYHLDTNIKIFYLVTYGHCTFSDIFSPSLNPEVKPENRPRVKFIVDNILGDLEVDMEGMKFFIKSMEDLKKAGFQLEPGAFLTNKKGLALLIKSLELLVDDDTPSHQAFSSLEEGVIWLGETENIQAIRCIRDELLEKLRTQQKEHLQKI